MGLMGNITESKKLSLISLCKLYKGASINPYCPEKAKGEEWALVYLKNQIWDTESSFVNNFSFWCELWLNKNPGLFTDKDIYDFVINIKLRKMERPDINFSQIFKSL